MADVLWAVAQMCIGFFGIGFLAGRWIYKKEATNG